MCKKTTKRKPRGSASGFSSIPLIHLFILHGIVKWSRSVVSGSLRPHALQVLLSSSVHGIFQARLLEWVATSFSRGSSWLRDRTQVSCTVGRRFTVWATIQQYKFSSFVYHQYYYFDCSWHLCFHINFRISLYNDFRHLSLDLVLGFDIFLLLLYMSSFLKFHFLVTTVTQKYRFHRLT